VHHLRRRRADAGLVIALVGVERAPLRPAVDAVLLNDEAAVAADDFAVFGVGLQAAIALGTGRLFVGLLRVFDLAGVLLCSDGC
jgi:hypothetical protein